MKAVLARVRQAALALLNVPVKLWRKEPTRVVSILTAAIIFCAAHWHVVLDEQTVSDALLIVLPILLGGELVRSQVWSPATIGRLLTKLGVPAELSDQVAAAVQAVQAGAKK